MKNLDAVYAEKIAAEYTVKPASKLVALKKLDRRPDGRRNFSPIFSGLPAH